MFLKPLAFGQLSFTCNVSVMPVLKRKCNLIKQVIQMFMVGWVVGIQVFSVKFFYLCCVFIVLCVACL